jgi:hypothetical protein
MAAMRKRVRASADLEKDAKKYKKALETLTEQVRAVLVHLDELMQQPSTRERGVKVAKLLNKLNMANDLVRYSTLRIDFQNDLPMDRDQALAVVPLP